jgi:hypothetical protein
MQVLLKNKQTIEFEVKIGRDIKDTYVSGAYIVETGMDATDAQVDEVYAYHWDRLEDAYNNYHADPEEYEEVTGEIEFPKVG